MLRRHKLSNLKIRGLAERAFPWIAFGAMLFWGWRVRDIWNRVPAYQDVLEFAWGINWYYDAILVHHISPGFTSAVFHPLGWNVFTWGYTPALFLLAIPLKLLGGTAFAFNVLTLGSVVLAFAGAQRFMRLYTGAFVACIAALVFTFTDFRFFRVGGHVNIAYMTAFLPWFLWSLERFHRTSRQTTERRLLLVCGVFWGLMINSALYGIFLGLICFAIWGRSLFRLVRLKQAIAITLIAFLVASPAILLYAVGNRTDATIKNGPDALQGWSASLNSLFIPSVVHPFEPIRTFARAIYSGPRDESGMANIGLVTAVLAIIGLWVVVRQKREARSLLALAAVGLVLALGLVLRWNGQTIPLSSFSGVDHWLWHSGLTLKPQIFRAGSAPPGLATGLPLPGFAATILAPFWESARVLSRYAFVGGIAMIGLAAIGLQRLGNIGRVLVAGLWLVEALPVPTANAPLITEPHPAFVWIAQQRFPPGEGIIDMGAPSLVQGGEVIYATQFHHAATASIVGSSWPQAEVPLWMFFADDNNLSKPAAALMLKQYHVRYVLFHLRGPDEQRRWELLRENASFLPRGCFEPIKAESPWPYPICIAEVASATAPGIQVALTDGWSSLEPWGVWADQRVSRAGWLSQSIGAVRLTLDARPNCRAGTLQQVMIVVNGLKLLTHTWETCTPWKATLPVPATAVRKGWNDIKFSYVYAERPEEGTDQESRTLAVAFTQLSVEHDTR